MEDIRYIQRFQNFEKSFILLQNSLDITEPSIVEKAGVMHFFETTFELSWKLVKDYLSFIGHDVNSPREAIKQSFQIELINQGDIWLKALTDRNLSVHTYDEEMANNVYKKINNIYFHLLNDLYDMFKSKICTD